MQRHLYRAFERQQFHAHAETRIVLLLSGGFREEGYGASGVFSRGDIIIRPAFAGHGDWAAQSGASYLQIKAPAAFVAKRRGEEFWKARRGAIELDDRNVSRALAAPTAAEFLLESAAEDAYGHFNAPNRIERAAMLLSGDGHQDIEKIAQDAAMRPDSFSRSFKTRFGVSPRDYAKAARLERAMAKVAAGAGSLAEIAHACGFYDQSHLCRAFREKLAMTPLEFSRQFAC
ncbi:MAG: helix-turn-helix transcriptional regulator [Parvularculaceae bacterium]